MAYKSIFAQETPTQGGGGYQSIFGFKTQQGMSTEDQKKRDQAYKIAAAQQNAAQLNAQVSKNQADKQSIVSDVKNYGVSAATDSGKQLVNSIISLPKDVIAKAKAQFDYLSGGKSNPNHIPVADIASAQKQAQSLPADLQAKTSRISADAGLTLLKMVKDGKSTKDISTFLNKAVADKTTLDKKAVGNALQGASLVAGGGGVAESFAEGGVRAAAGDILGTGVSGAVGGAGNVIANNPNANPLDVAKGAAVGAGVGVGAGVVGGLTGQALKKDNKVVSNAILDEPKPPTITDSAHLLPANTASRTAEVTGRLDEINTRLDEIKTGKAPATTFSPSLPDKNNLGTTPTATEAPLTAGGKPDMRTSAAKRQGVVTPTASTAKSVTGAEVRALNKERDSLTAELENMQRVAPVSQLDDVNRRISAAQANPSTTPQEALALKQERDGIRQKIATDSPPDIQQGAAAMDTVSNTNQVAQQYSGGGEHFVPRVAQKTEARAVADGLAGPDGFQNLPTATRMNLDQQANAAVDMVKTNPDAAKAVAMGTAPPPDGIQATAVYKAVEADAAKKGDASTLQALAEESTIPKQATQAGQFNAALAAKDPESPVDIMRQINALRGKTANADVSKFVTRDEAQQITTMAQDVATKKEAALAAVDNPSTRLEYGRARVALDNYVDALKGPALKRTARQVIQQEGISGATKSVIETVGGTAKAIRATFDNSALGRQGIKTLLTHPTIWAKNSLKSFSDLVREFGGKPVLDELKADIISRPNALNGMYKQIGADVLDTTEEQFPQHLPEQIWGLRRFVKASDAAYTGFVQRSRADLADAYINIAKKSGVNLADKAQAEPIGKMVNALTGRGYLHRDLNLVNNVFFSPRLLKSHIDVLTAHVFQKGVTPFVRKQAAVNLLKIVGGTAAALTLADKVRPGSVEWDPRSANFGKIKIGDTRFDITGGMSAVATLAARLATTSTKSSTSGDVTSLTSGKFGAQTGLDVVNDFFQNKLAPAPGVIAALLKGSDFNGKPTRNLKYIGTNLTVPLSITNYQELKNDPKSANKLVAAIADGLGFSTNTYGKQQTDWRNSTSKELQGFKQSVPEATLLKANDEYNQQYGQWLDKVNSNPNFNKLGSDDRATVRTNKQSDIRTKVLKAYGYTYKRAAPNKALKGF